MGICISISTGKAEHAYLGVSLETVNASVRITEVRAGTPAAAHDHLAVDDVDLGAPAGEVIEAVSGQSWEEFVRSRILRRVGMAHSDVRYPGAERPGNVATPHATRPESGAHSSLPRLAASAARISGNAIKMLSRS